MKRHWPLMSAAGAGGALSASHAPLDVHLLAFLVPLLFVAGVDGAARRGLPAWWMGAAAGAVGHGLLLAWLIAPAGFIGWGLLVAVQVAWWALLAAVIRWMPTGHARPLLVGLAWIGIDAIRGIWPLNGFAWGSLGAATVDLPWLNTLARLAGEKAMTLAVVVLAVAVWEAVRAPIAEAWNDADEPSWEGLRDALPAGGIGTAWLVGTAVVVSLATIGPPPPVGTVDVLLVQPSDIAEWEGTTRDRMATIAASALSLTEESIARDGAPDLAVWPESTIDTDPARLPALADALEAGGALTGGRLLAGSNLDGPRPGTFLNTVQVIERDGTTTERYQKRRLVPFGEYIPLRRALEWFPPLDQVPRDGLPHPHPHNVQVDGIRVAVAICFETLFSWVVRDNVLAGPEPAALVIAATNDATFGVSGEPRQHLAQSQLRALETGRWVAHAAITGSSAFVDPDGRIHQPTGLFEITSIRQEVDLVEGRTPFLVTGDWLAFGGAAALLVLAMLGLRARRAARAAPGQEQP